MATKQTSSELLQSFSLAIKEQLADERTKYLSSFESWESLFSYVTEISKNERIVLVIDEYSYLAESEKSISSLLQKYIGNEWKKDAVVFDFVRFIHELYGGAGVGIRKSSVRTQNCAAENPSASIL